MWILFALLAAVFASLTAILAKIGIEGVNSNLATAIRTVVVMIMAWGIVFITGRQHEIPNINQKSWIFLILSGVATGLSWLFFYKALQNGDVSKVVPIDKLSIAVAILFSLIIFKEKLTKKALAGLLILVAGTLLLLI